MRAGDYEQMKRDSADSSDYRQQYPSFSLLLHQKVLNLVFASIGLSVIALMSYYCFVKYNEFIDGEDDMLTAKYQWKRIKMEEAEGVMKKDKWLEKRNERNANIEKLHLSIEEKKNEVKQLNATVEVKRGKLDKLQLQSSHMNELMAVTNVKIGLINEIAAIKNNINKLTAAVNELNLKEGGNTMNEPMKLNSKIITSNQEVTLIKNYFKDRKVKTLQLLYRRSDQGSSPKVFHAMCDGIPNTLTLADTGVIILGGFTSQEWSGEGIYKNDPNAFLFNLKKNAKCPIKDTSNAIYCSESSLPSFGNGDFYFSGKQAVSLFPHAYSTESDNINDFMEGRLASFVKEIEVFRVIFN